MEKIKEMSIDLETYSDVDIKKSGVYKYAESENFEILLFAVSINGDDVIVYDLACGDVLPDEILDAIVSDDVIKWAFNASFERICLSYWMKRNYPDRFCSYSIPEDTVGNYLNPASWRCTMIWSAYMGLPLSLEGVGTVLGLKDQKIKEGKDLIRYFCVPCKPTKSNGGRTRNLPMHRIDCSCYIANSSSQSTSQSVLHLQKIPLACGVPFFYFLQYLLLEEVPLLI